MNLGLMKDDDVISNLEKMSHEYYNVFLIST